MVRLGQFAMGAIIREIITEVNFEKTLNVDRFDDTACFLWST